ncbi:FAD-binding oxidoreductase [Streptomyces sp. NPDC093225]|uniref:FAD-binding oxidoreductase n=1 Tax=Streptomyces sp. NPDC093225 TaxID=3366034 RepID=UPI00381DB09B
MAPHSKARTALTELREDLTGEVFAPDDPGYDGARQVFNAMIDRRPAVIAQCADAEDVVRAVRFARDLDLAVAVRGGGHSVAGMALCDNGLVVDLRRMHEVTVHPAAKAARVQGGATMSHLDRACEPHGLATPGGRASTTGVGGFVLGGGDGWLSRAFGLASDNLLGVELVTADGQVVEATAEENPELFWALHGGGGNFGIATALTLRLHDLPAMSIAMAFCLPEYGPQLVATYREVIEAGPTETAGGVIYLTAPPEPFIPEHLVGQRVSGVLLTYPGPDDELRKLAEPLLAIPHEVEMVMPIPYAELQCMLDDPPGMRNYWSAEYLTGIPDAFVDAFCALGDAMPVPTGTQHVVWPQGGAIAAGAADWPLGYRRDATWAVHPFGVWEDPSDDERVREWVRDVRAGVAPWSTGATYLNFIGDEGADRVAAGLGPENMQRLGRVKREYDPDNVFRFNHNVKPL